MLFQGHLISAGCFEDVFPALLEYKLLLVGQIINPRFDEQKKSGSILFHY
jgi:hypothetical protein